MAISPQAYFVERIGGKRVRVQVVVGPAQSPHHYDPTPRQIAELSGSKAYFSIGIPFEQRLIAMLRESGTRVVATQAGIELREIDGLCDHGDADERGHHEHDHGGAKDPHIWLSPRLVKKQAESICTALCELDAAHADEYRANLLGFQADLDRVHEEIATALAPLKGREFFVFHPAFGYFADEFGLRQTPIEIAGKEPSPRQIAELVSRARAANVRIIFVQPQFAPHTAEAVARGIGGVVAPIDPQARDYLQNLREMAEKIRAALTPDAE